MTGRYPRRFGKYLLLKPLAKGGMGEIYLAAGGEVGGFEKLCVIKKVITEKADRAKAKRFLDEAKVVLRLSHSALVTTFDAGDVGGEFYIAMELVEGKDLREVWNRCVRTRQRIPLDVALHVVREVARALAYVHGYGDLKLVHRDVAPPNILLSYVGDVKLTDFGLARSILKQEHTAPGVVFGRAAYLAPEQARGEIADARTDVYTLGIVLWELLTGQQFLQLGGLDPAAALAIVRNPKLVPPSTRAPWISPALDQVVTKALAADRLQRFQTAEELRQALGEVIGDIAPRADSTRVAEFLRTIYSETIDEERAERDRFMKELIPQFRAGLLVEDSEAAGEGERSPEPRPAARPIEPTPARTTPGGLKPLDPPAVRVTPSGLRPLDPPRTTPTGTRQAEGGAEPARPALLPALRPARPSAPLRLPGLPPTAQPLGGSNGAPLRRPTPAGPEGRREPDPIPLETKAPPGRVVAGCRLTRSLVEGRLGSLHRAVRGNQEVAVRILEEPAPDAATMERMRDDARRVARLGHPHLASVSEVGGTDDGRLCAVLEPVAGKDLAALLRTERRLDGGRAMEIAVQVARALAAAHSVGVLHLRLEPERVLVGAGTDPVRVLDVAVGISTRPAVGEAESVLYRAPEQLSGGPVDARTDVYALAAMLYELLTGAPPHAGSSDPAARKLSEPVQSPRMFRPEMPLEVERLLTSALDRDPASRPPTMAAFEQGLLAATRGAAAAAGPAPRTGAPGTPEDRRRGRREAAFRVIGELLSAPGGAPAEAPPPGRLPVSEASPAAAGFGGALLDRYAPPPPPPRPGLSRGAYALAVLGSLGVAAALAWRLLR
jgi:serine/threonine protein kinase